MLTAKSIKRLTNAAKVCQKVLNCAMMKRIENFQAEMGYSSTLMLKIPARHLILICRSNEAAGAINLTPGLLSSDVITHLHINMHLHLPDPIMAQLKSLHFVMLRFLGCCCLCFSISRSNDFFINFLRFLYKLFNKLL